MATHSKAATLPQTAQEPATATVAPVDIEQAPATRPKPRRFRLRANEKCPQDGAFNGVCLVYCGDTWEQIFEPLWRQLRDVKGRPIVERNGMPKMGWIEQRLPSHVDVIAEYEIDTAPRHVAIPRLPGAAPEMPRSAAAPIHAPPGLGPSLPFEGTHR